MDSTIKFYGGEPTIDAVNLIWVLNYLREKGFRGWFTVFSNGVLASRVIEILEADAQTDVVLNYSILHGEDAEPIPPKSLQKLKKIRSAKSEPHLFITRRSFPLRTRRGICQKSR